MKTLEEYRTDFIKQAEEYDLGRKEEDFHSYLRTHNLEHLLSETEKIERNRKDASLNSIGLMTGIGVPITLGMMVGIKTRLVHLGKGLVSSRMDMLLVDIKMLILGIMLIAQSITMTPQQT